MRVERTAEQQKAINERMAKVRAGLKRGKRGQYESLKRTADEREIVFLGNYYGQDSLLHGNRVASALDAGYTGQRADHQGNRILKKYGDLSFKSSMKAVGITKPYLAIILRQILDLNVLKNSKEVIAALRLTLANLGEATDQSQGTGGTTFTGPVMMIVGATPERMKALREAVPQLTRAELEEESNRRSAEKLELLKQGKLPPLEHGAGGHTLRTTHLRQGRPRKACPDEPFEAQGKERVIDVQAEGQVSNLDDGDAGGDQETKA